MHPEEIKAALRMSGWTQVMLADDLNVSRSSVTQTIVGGSRSARIQQRISDILGKPVKAIWPGQVVLRRDLRRIAKQQGVELSQKVAAA